MFRSNPNIEITNHISCIPHLVSCILHYRLPITCIQYLASRIQHLVFTLCSLPSALCNFLSCILLHRLLITDHQYPESSILSSLHALCPMLYAFCIQHLVFTLCSLPSALCSFQSCIPYQAQFFHSLSESSSRIPPVALGCKKAILALPAP